MSKYLIQITIGPVQEFIASARKLRDIWFGSDLLSELSKTVARSLKEQGADLIFPFVASHHDLEPSSPLIVANKILAELSVETSPADVIATARKAWLAHRDDVAEKALEKIRKIGKISVNEALYQKQISDFGEFYAAWVELTDNYRGSKASLEKLLAGRKNLREFNAPTWKGSGIPKNSLDGIREAVTGDNQAEIRGLIKKNEKLDTLGCIKRFYPMISGRGKCFDDLSNIAVTPWLKGLEGTIHTALLQKFVSHFIEENQNANVEIPLQKYADCFYLEREALKQHGALEDYHALKFIIGDPQKYACIFVGDGDHMGKSLDRIETAAGHRTFARQLGLFVKKIGDTIEQYEGSLIYAGGDDVMAYVPLHTVIDCADAIRKMFAETMETIYSELKLSGDQPTFSIGIAVVHHATPLDQALNTARKAERVAKDEGDRNALAMIQNKRGGGELTIWNKWENSNGGGIISRFESICDLYNAGTLPSTLGYQLRRASIDAGDDLLFRPSEDGQNIVPLNAASASVIRIFDQKEHSESLKTLLLHQTSIRNLSNELVVARQIANAQKMSKGEMNREIPIDNG